ASTVSMKDLFSRTVFYKVGHHGSHNATLREDGLELMGGDLVAMIPADEQMAAAQGRKGPDGKPQGWSMPFPALLTRLETKTHGRVIRLDSGVPVQRGPELSQLEWNSFTKAIDEPADKLYIDYTIIDE